MTLTGSTSPLKVISPVIARSEWTSLPENKDTSAVTIVTPAEGPSFPTAPAGKCRWMSAFDKPARSVKKTNSVFFIARNAV